MAETSSAMGDLHPSGAELADVSRLCQHGSMDTKIAEHQQSRGQQLATFALVVLGPPVVWTLPLWLANVAPGHLSFPTSAGLLLAAFLTGSIGIWRLKVRRASLLFIMPAYWVLMGMIMLLWALSFVCGKFGECM